jgi:serine/threonine protein kinase
MGGPRRRRRRARLQGDDHATAAAAAPERETEFLAAAVIGCAIISGVIPPTLLHYRVIQPLGSGGMGAVFLAEDTKLGRRVALKVLPPGRANDPESRQRFEREARAVAALNHPNIVTIHAVEQADDVTFLAMELIEGQTLSTHIRAGGLPARDILRIAIPIADAMAVAHQRGITHRDLKPGNIMVGADGRVKVLDFGLAKLTGAAPFDDVTRTRGEANSLTGEGRLVGTVSYMSPEQVEGKPTDGRSDIFSLGVVIYEMASGVRPFTGDSTVAVLSAILRDAPPPVNEINQSLPGELARIVRRALAKDPDQRYQTAKDLRNDLVALKEDLDSGALQTFALNEVHPKRARRRLPAVAIGMVVIGMLAVAIGLSFTGASRWFSSDEQLPFERIELARLTSSGNVSRSALSGDGRYLVYVVNEGGSESLWLRHLATSSNVQIVEPGGLRIFHVGFTPDGNFVFYVGSPPAETFATAFQVPVLGGPPRRIIHDVDSSLAYSPDGTRFAFMRGHTARGEDTIVVANSDGTGERELAGRKRPLSYRQGVIAWSADGRAIVAVRRVDAQPRVKVALVDVQTAAETLIGDSWTDINAIARLPDGQGIVIAARETPTSAAQVWHLSLSAPTTRRITRDLNDYSQLALSADGRTLVATQTETAGHLWVLPLANPNDARQITTGPNRNDGTRGVAWTPDGRIVYAADAGSGNRDIWIVDDTGQNARRLTDDPADDLGPVVTPNGRSILFVSPRPAGSIWQMDLDGANQRPVVTVQAADWPLVTKDGRWIYYTLFGEARRSVWRMPLAGGPAERMTARWPALGISDEDLFYHASMVLFDLTPDGTHGLGFYSDPDRRGYRVGLFPLTPGSPTRFDIHTATGTVSTLDGRELIHWETRAGQARLLRTPFTGGPATVIANLPPGTVTGAGVRGGRRIALSPDGKHLAMSIGKMTSDVVRITEEK